MNETDKAYADVWYVVKLVFWIFIAMYIAAKII